MVCGMGTSATPFQVRSAFLCKSHANSKEDLITCYSPRGPSLYPPGVRGSGVFSSFPPVLWRAEPRWEWCCKVTKSAGSWRRVNSTQRPNKSEIVSRRSVCWIAFGLDSIYIHVTTKICYLQPEGADDSGAISFG